MKQSKMKLWVVALVLALSGVANAATITVDGDPSDWGSIPYAAQNPNAPGNQPIGIKLTNDANNLYFLLTFASPIVLTNIISGDINLDSDKNVTTGGCTFKPGIDYTISIGTFFSSGGTPFLVVGGGTWITSGIPPALVSCTLINVDLGLVRANGTIVEGSIPLTGLKAATPGLTGFNFNVEISLTGTYTLTAAAAINLSAEIPAVTQAPPITTFPSYATGITNVQAFMAAHRGEFSPSMRNYIQDEIDRMAAKSDLLWQPMLPAYGKVGLTLLADGLSLGATAANLIDDVWSVTQSKTAAIAGYYLVSAVSASASLLPPPDSQALMLAHESFEWGLIATKGLSFAGSGVAVVPILIAADIKIWTDYFPTALRGFAMDPVTPDFRVPVPVILPTLAPITGTTQDAFLTAWRTATLYCVTYLEATNASFDRYVSAVQASDNIAATTQLAAYLHYLRLFSEALADASTSYAQLPAVLAQLGLTEGKGTAADLLAMQSLIASQGLSPDVVAFLKKYGMTDADVAAYTRKLINLPYSSAGPDLTTFVATTGRLLLGLQSKKVSIDIRPHNATNSIYLRSQGDFRVAILGTATFDASQVDPATVVFAGASPKLRAKRNRYACRLEDVNGDRLQDLVCVIPISQLELQGADTAAMLTATTYAGQAIAGIDAVKVIP